MFTFGYGDPEQAKRTLILADTREERLTPVEIPSTFSGFRYTLGPPLLPEWSYLHQFVSYERT